MTIVVDDAGYGDLLFGVVVGAYRPGTGDFFYDVIDVRHFQRPLFEKKTYELEASRIVQGLVQRMKISDDESVSLCQGTIFDEAAGALKKSLGVDRVKRIRVEGEAQRLTELAYLEELRNLGYEPLEERSEKRAKSFYHMLRWLEAHPSMLRRAKTGWPKLVRYRLFRERHS